MFEIFIQFENVKNVSRKARVRKTICNSKKILSPLLYNGAFFNYVDKMK